MCEAQCEAVLYTMYLSLHITELDKNWDLDLNLGTACF